MTKKIVFVKFLKNLFKSSRVNFLDKGFGLGLAQRAGVIGVELLEVGFGLLIGVVESESFDDLLSFRKIFKMVIRSFLAFLVYR